MDPVSMAIMAAGAVTKGISSLVSGFLSSSAYDLQAKIAAANVDLLTKRAGLEREGGKLSEAEGTLDIARTSDKLARTYGAETSYYGANHLDPSSGSPLLVQAYSAAQGSTDIQLIAAKARMGVAQAYGRAAGTMAQAYGAAGQEAYARMGSHQAMLSGILGAATALLGGGADIWKGLPGAPGTSTVGGAGGGDGGY